MKTIERTNQSIEPRTQEEHAACAAEMSRFIEANRPAIEALSAALDAEGCGIQLRITALGNGNNYEVAFAAKGAT